MFLKTHLSDLLRKLNLLSTAEQARFYLQKLKYKKDNSAFKNKHPGFLLPPEFFIYETYRLNYKWYYEDGRNTAEEIVTLFSKHFDLTKQNIRILDWGCGPGRIIRHFHALLPKAEIYGTDYNEKYINWCSENLKEINFSVNKIDPPMKYKNSFFDVIIGLSIFTHLSEKNHFDWIQELYRISQFDGGVLITTQGEGYYPKLTGPEKKAFNSNQLVTRKYLDEGNRLYSSFQPIGFMHELIKGRFQILEFIPGKIGQNEPSQDHWLLKKI